MATALLSKAGKHIGKAFDLKYTTDLHDEDLLKLLAACSEDCYCFRNAGDDVFEAHQWNTPQTPARDREVGHNPRLPGYVDLVEFQIEDSKHTMLTQWGLYRIVHGPHMGSTILAFRGTDTARGARQDISMIVGRDGGSFRRAIQECVATAEEKMPTWVCGHSLGGCLAECVTSHTGIGGAAFNAPGPWVCIQTRTLYPHARSPARTRITRMHTIERADKHVYTVTGTKQSYELCGWGSV